MSQIQINFDTVTKEASVSMDGVVMPDVVYACLGSYEGKFYISVEQSTEDKENKSMTRKTTIASDNAPGRTEEIKTAKAEEDFSDVFSVLAELAK